MLSDVRETSNRRWFGLVAVSLAVATIIVDSTVVNVAVPSIVAEFDATSTDVLWIQESYTVVFAALLLTFGGLADALGRRRVLLVGVAVFTLASVGAALAPTTGALIAARLVQGVGGAMVLPTTLSLVNATFTGRERGIAFAVWGSTIGGMTAVGPVLGGWLTTDFSWRWAFGINVVLGAAIVVGTLLFVDESRQEGPVRIDGLGAALSAVTCGALVFGLVEGRELGWWTTRTRLSAGSWTWSHDLSPVPLSLLLALVAGTVFVLAQRRRTATGRSALLAVDLLRIPSFRNGNVVAMVVALGEFGLVLVIPLWLQNVLGYSAVQAGLVLLGLAVGAFAASGLAGATSGRLDPLAVVRWGLVCEIAGIAGVGIVVSADTPWTAVVPFLVVYGFGVGLATAQLTSVVLRHVPVGDSGRASGTQSTARQLGSALGIAVVGTVLYTTVQSTLTATLDRAGVDASTARQVVDGVVGSSGGSIAALDGATRTAAEVAFSDGTRVAAFTAAAFLAVGLACTRSLGDRRRSVTEEADLTRG